MRIIGAIHEPTGLDRTMQRTLLESATKTIVFTRAAMCGQMVEQLKKWGFPVFISPQLSPTPESGPNGMILFRNAERGVLVLSLPQSIGFRFDDVDTIIFTDTDLKPQLEAYVMQAMTRSSAPLVRVFFLNCARQHEFLNEHGIRLMMDSSDRLRDVVKPMPVNLKFHGGHHHA